MLGDLGDLCSDKILTNPRVGFGSLLMYVYVLNVSALKTKGQCHSWDLKSVSQPLKGNAGQTAKESHVLWFVSVLVLAVKGVTSELKGPSISENYQITWGNDHVFTSNQGRQVQLSLDQASGHIYYFFQRAGFESKLSYGSGFFHMNIKLPGSNSAGVVTAFYLRSHSEYRRDELDFEFLGNKEGKPYTLQTNVITEGQGNREQRIHLWFDPTAAYHSYRILWNQHQIVFFVDDVPIRVFKNKQNIGVGYPSSQPLKLVASLWNGDSWATDGGQTKVNWTYAPFKAGFRSFDIYGCQSHGSSSTQCLSSKFYWNREQYWALSPSQEKDYQWVKTDYMNYDYCTDWKRFGAIPPECPQ
ncbi:hypothetical protein Tsubulata_002536 [Turnera subulata]|uniref:Xyloglucan endotransglucosylase/hydrolase n=1 Tax=Turnera subulata TaxID=218843 RepID=A0A9Q0GCQ4_9ROSI|nr:hypothetical protein Tsubulata_002536 [Turnera subulata]